MSTRSERATGAEKYAKVLQDLLKLPDNKGCADCGDKGPRWASVNLGIFICMRCAGIHRQMGTHISKVKSTTLDSWVDEWVQAMQEMGNEKANAIWEARARSKPNPSTAQAELERFIRDKYERRLFRDDNGRPREEERRAPEPAAPVARKDDGVKLQIRTNATEQKPAPPARRPQPQPQAQPQPVVQAQPAPVAAPKLDSLLSFDDPTPAPAPAAKSDSFASFGDFASLAQTPAPQAQAPPVDAKNDIMRMFDSTPMPMYMGGQMGGQMGGHMGGMHGQMGGMHGQMGGMPGQMGGHMGGMQSQMGGMQGGHMGGMQGGYMGGMQGAQMGGMPGAQMGGMPNNPFMSGGGMPGAQMGGGMHNSNPFMGGQMGGMQAGHHMGGMPGHMGASHQNPHQHHTHHNHQMNGYPPTNGHVNHVHGNSGFHQQAHYPNHSHPR